jgi:hypothetical protein
MLALDAEGRIQIPIAAAAAARADHPRRAGRGDGVSKDALVAGR